MRRMRFVPCLFLSFPRSLAFPHLSSSSFSNPSLPSLLTLSLPSPLPSSHPTHLTSPHPPTLPSHPTHPQNLSTAVSSFKSIFNAASSATRGQELLLVKLPNNAGLAVEFEGEVLGKVLGVEGGVLAREMMIGYFVEKNPNSPKVSLC